ncbi:MAG: sulfate permease, partial [Pseudomonadota bacterium]
MTERGSDRASQKGPLRARLRRVAPILDWGASYSFGSASSDLLAAAIVTIMLIPQSLAYALLAGLPAEVGLYASIAPLLLYAVFGGSRTLAVGPVAVVSLMTAAALGEVAEAGTADYAAAALALALMSGILLVAMGALRLGFLANFLSHPVIAGFIAAAGAVIAAGQLPHLLGVEASGHDLWDIGGSLIGSAAEANPATAAVGLSALAFLWWCRAGLRGALRRFGVGPAVADALAKAGPVVAVAASTTAVAVFGLDEAGVAIVGDVPQGLPPFVTPPFDFELWRALLPAALIISIIGFVESVSVAQTLAAKRRQRIVPDQELIGLGAANVGAAFTGGYPVTGGFARSVVNFDAGAVTPAAGVFTAVGIAATALFLTPLLHYLPKATLAATIVVAVLGLIDLKSLKRNWRFSRGDFAAQAATILLTLRCGVEVGVASGIALSVALHLLRTVRPHVAVVGRVPGTEHFRNVKRRQVETAPELLSVRIDESLYFANARFLEDYLSDAAARDPALRHVVLVCAAVNDIDGSALESLEAINLRLDDAGVAFHLSEVKGPVMDRLRRSDFLDRLTGRVFLSQFDAWRALSGDRGGADGGGR